MPMKIKDPECYWDPMQPNVYENQNVIEYSRWPCGVQNASLSWDQQAMGDWVEGSRGAGSTGHEQKQRGGTCLLPAHLMRTAKPRSRSAGWKAAAKVGAFVSSSRGEDDPHDPLIISWLTFWLAAPEMYTFPRIFAPRQHNPNPLPS